MDRGTKKIRDLGGDEATWKMWALIRQEDTGHEGTANIYRHPPSYRQGRLTTEVDIVLVNEQVSVWLCHLFEILFSEGSHPSKYRHTLMPRRWE